MKIFQQKWFHIGLALIMLLVIVWLLHVNSFLFTPLVIFVKTLFLPFLIAGILFYLTRPLVDLLEKIHLPRTLGILVIFLIIIGVLAIIVSWLVPIIQAQLARLVDNIPNMINVIQDSIVYWQQHQDIIPDYINQIVNKIGNKLQGIVTGLLQRLQACSQTL